MPSKIEVEKSITNKWISIFLSVVVFTHENDRAARNSCFPTKNSYLQDRHFVVVKRHFEVHLVRFDKLLVSL